MKTLLFFFAVMILTSGKLSAQSMEQDIVEKKFEIEIKNDSVFARNENKEDHFKLRIYEYVDFNADGLSDIITIDTASCGNWGDCIYSFFLQQPDASYECLFSDYLYKFDKKEDLVTPPEEKWLVFNVYRRTDISGNLTAEKESDLKQEEVLEFNGKRYVVKQLDTNN